MMKDPTKGIGECIVGVEAYGSVEEAKTSVLDPLLDGETLDVDVLSAWSLLVCVTHHDGCLVVNVEWSRVGERLS